MRPASTAIVLVLLAACSGSPAAVPPAPGTDYPVSAATAAMPSSSVITPPTDATLLAPVTSSPPPPSSAATSVEACRGTLRGAVTADVVRPAGPNGAASSLWFEPDEAARAGLAASGQAGLSVNCDDRAASILVLLGAGTPAAAVPAGPGRYAVTADGRPGTFTVLVAVAGDARAWRVVDGEVDLQAHDTRRVAGTVRARLSEPGGARVELAATFDHACTGGSRCGR